ncbi:MAG: hypothetical protein OHK0017_05010 [Patescibacteria group bacterium]
MTTFILPPKANGQVKPDTSLNKKRFNLKRLSFKTWNKILAATLSLLMIGVAASWSLNSTEVFAYGPEDGAKYNSNENCLNTAYSANYKSVKKDYENVLNCFTKNEAKYCAKDKKTYSSEYCQIAQRNIRIVKASYVGSTSDTSSALVTSDPGYNSNSSDKKSYSNYSNGYSSSNNYTSYDDAYFGREFNVCTARLPDYQSAINCLNDLLAEAQQANNTYYINQITNSRNTIQNRLDNYNNGLNNSTNLNYTSNNNYTTSTYSTTTYNTTSDRINTPSGSYTVEQLSRMRYDIDAELDDCRTDYNRYADAEPAGRCAQSVYRRSRQINYERGMNGALNFLAYISRDNGDISTSRDLYQRSCTRFNDSSSCEYVRSIDNYPYGYSRSDYASNCSRYSNVGKNRTACDIAKVAAVVVVIGALVAALDS